MYIIFKEIKQEDNIKIEALFADETSYINRVSTRTIIQLLKESIPEDQKELVDFKSVYAGQYKFEDCPPILGKNEIKDIHILVKLIKGHVSKIMEVSDELFRLNRIAELLNQEVENNDVCYMTFSVRGKITSFY